MTGLCNWLFSYAQNRPYFHLPFMRRYWLIRPSRWFPLAVRLHIITGSDPGNHLHDHPWHWASLILRGEYYETVQLKGGKLRTSICGPGSLRIRRSTTLHRVGVPAGHDPVWTIFIMGRKHREWGFLRKGKWVHWQEYQQQVRSKR